MNGYEGMCMSGGKFLKPWQVKDKIIDGFLYNSHSTIFKVCNHKLSQIMLIRLNIDEMSLGLWGYGHHRVGLTSSPIMGAFLL